MQNEMSYPNDQVFIQIETTEPVMSTPVVAKQNDETEPWYFVLMDQAVRNY